MRLRIQFKQGPRVARTAKTPKAVTFQEMAAGVVFLLTPAVLGLWALALWRLAADMNLARPFFLSAGPFSHWQPWFVSALLAQALLFALRRYAGPSGASYNPVPEPSSVVRVAVPGPWAG
jgi:hypothetical protein